MPIAIYRKYRPQTFAEVVGQNHIKTTIQSELENGKIAHAYLFSGPRGLGKTTMARLLAKAVNCLNRQPGQSEPCNTCEACKEVVENRSIDMIEIDAASHTGVENVRDNIINSSRFTPTSRKFKVFILDEVHMLSPGAFNALLKTLEEPPAHVIFILATTEIHKVPETIISRCQHFDFRKVTTAEIIGRLSQIAGKEGLKIDQPVLENIAYFSEGCLRDGESLLGQILSLGEKEITMEQAELVLPRMQFDLALELIEYLNRRDGVAAIELINNLAAEGINLERFSGNLIEALRKMLLLKISPPLGQFGRGLNKDLEKKISQLAEQTAIDFLIKAVEVLIRRRQELKFAEIVQLPLELAVLEIIAEENYDEDKTPPGKPRLAAEKKIIKSGESDNLSITPNKEAPKLTGALVGGGTPPFAKGGEEKPKKTLGQVSLTLPQVKGKWPEVMVCLKKYNQSLAATLNISQPSQIDENGILEICFRHKFHQQRINDLKNKQILEKVLAEIFGQRLSVKTAVMPPSGNKIEVQALAETQAESPIADILQIFGGQVVE